MTPPTVEFFGDLQIPKSRVGELTWEVAQLFPVQGDWTEEDYFSLDLTRGLELCDGCLEVLPMPVFTHQFLVDAVYRRLKAFVQKAKLPGCVMYAPFVIRLGRKHMRLPDVVYVRPERIIDNDTPPNGADLVVEVVSPGKESRDRDLVRKRRFYAAAGIAEYWIVDPDEQLVLVLTLKGKTYRVHGTFGAHEFAESKLLAGFRVDVTKLFAEGRRSAKTQPHADS